MYCTYDQLAVGEGVAMEGYRRDNMKSGQFYELPSSVGVLVEIRAVADEDCDRRQDEDTGSYQCEGEKLVIRTHKDSSMSSMASKVARAMKKIAASPGLLHA